MDRGTNQQESNTGGRNLEPLATYLEPRFGNIYECNPGEQLWTDELRDAVKQYLVHEVADDDYGALLDWLLYRVPDGPREAQADFIIEHHEAWEIAYALHIAAVKAVPTLAELIGEQSSAWELEDRKEDVVFWLRAHANYEQLMAMAVFMRVAIPASMYPVIAGSDEAFFAESDLAVRLSEDLTPELFLVAWEYAVGPAHSDLTDEEWDLLVPVIPKGKKASAPEIIRLALNGMLYHHTYRPIFRAPIPLRYGKTQAVRKRYKYYKRAGVFGRMLAAVEGKPGAERLVAWLREVLPDTDRA